jgi:hypothetical protein
VKQEALPPKTFKTSKTLKTLLTTYKKDCFLEQSFLYARGSCASNYNNKLLFFVSREQNFKKNLSQFFLIFAKTLIYNTLYFDPQNDHKNITCIVQKIVVFLQSKDKIDYDNQTDTRAAI